MRGEMRTSAGRERSDSCVSNSSGGSGGLLGDVTSRRQSVCDVVKAGQLYMKRPQCGAKLQIKTWQKRYFVLRDHSYDSGTAVLEISSTEPGPGIKIQDCYTLDMRTVTRVDEYKESKSFPNALKITRHDHGPLIIGAESDCDVTDWMVAIQLLADKCKSADVIKQEVGRRPSCPSRLIHGISSQQHLNDVTNNNVVGSHHGNDNIPPRSRTNSNSSVRMLKLPGVAAPPACRGCLVRVQTTEASKRNNICGEYVMTVFRDHITLRRLHDNSDVMTWPIAHIRKFKSEDLSDGSNLVTLGADTSCGTKSGTFLFHTEHGRKLIQMVKDVLAEQNTHRDPDRDLELLRVKALNKAPSTPNLFSHGSHPKVIPKPQSKPKTAVRTRTQSNPEQSGARQSGLLHHLPEELTEPSRDAGEYVDDQLSVDTLGIITSSAQHSGSSPLQQNISIITSSDTDTIPAAETATVPIITSPSNSLPRTKASPKIVKKRKSGLPPLPPNGQHTSLPTVKTASVSLMATPADNDKPPELPPRRLSCTAPPPPPRPQHTLSTHSLPV